ncbi:MAG: PAS domain S-box protein [Opitutaceae bacterium]
MVAFSSAARFASTEAPDHVDPPLAFLTGFGAWVDLAGLGVVALALLLVVLFYRRSLRDMRRSEQRLRMLLEAAPFAVVVTRRDTGHFLFANGHAIKQLGLSPGGYRSQQVPYVDPRWSRAQLLELLARHGHVEHLEGEIQAQNGRRFPALTSAVLVRFDGVDAILGTFQDISQLREAELKVRSSEARMRAVFEAAPDGIVIVSPEGIIHHASDSSAALVGVAAADELTGKQVLDFLGNDDRASARELLEAVGSATTSEGPAFRIARPDGTHAWIEPRAVRSADPVTGHPAVVLVLRDISRRRAAQEALAAHAGELQRALDRVAHLQNAILRVCAWTKQVNVDGEWIPIERYLAQYLGLKLTHGISEEGLAMLDLPPEDEAPADKPPAP